MIDWILTNKEYENEIDHNDITLVGHSRGGGIVLIKASESKKIKRVITWAGVRDFKERFKIGSTEFKLWEQKGVTYIENGRTKQMMPHYFQFFEDFLKNESKFNIESAVGKLRIPYLVVHGEKDTSVEPKNGKLGNLFTNSLSGSLPVWILKTVIKCGIKMNYQLRVSPQVSELPQRTIQRRQDII